MHYKIAIIDHFNHGNFGHQDQWIGDSDNSKGPGNFGLWRWCTDTQVLYSHHNNDESIDIIIVIKIIIKITIKIINHSTFKIIFSLNLI